MTDAQLPEQHSDEHLELSRQEFDRENLSDADIEQIKEQREGDEPDGSFMRWVITLFGTGVGAGILFLPINAGSFGFWPLVIATLLIGPMVFFSHRTYARIVSASPVKGLDVLQVITALTGRKRGFASALVYWLGIYPTVLIYAISITNTLDSFIVNQLGGPDVSRWVLATASAGLMTGAYAFGKKLTLWLANVLVYPLIIALAAVSFYLIPSWDFASFRGYESSYSVWQGLLLILPVLVFSFSHMAALSQFALDVQKKTDGDVAATEREVSKVEMITAAMLVTFTMFFVWSCALSLGADGDGRRARGERAGAVVLGQSDGRAVYGLDQPGHRHRGDHHLLLRPLARYGGGHCVPGAQCGAELRGSLLDVHASPHSQHLRVRHRSDCRCVEPVDPGHDLRGRRRVRGVFGVHHAGAAV